MMNEEDKGFSEEVARLAKEATHEAFLRARHMLGADGIVLVRDNKLIRLFPDDSFTVLKDFGRFA